MTRRGLFGAMLGGIAAGLDIGKAVAAPFGLRPVSGSTARVAVVADDPELEFHVASEPPYAIVSGDHIWCNEYGWRRIPIGRPVYVGDPVIGEVCT